MSYGRDRDSYTRGSGAIAAADANNPRRARERRARLVRSEVRDSQLAGLTFGPRGGIAGLGAITAGGTGLTGGARRPVLGKGGAIEGGGSGKGGYGSGYGSPLDNAGRLPPKNPPPLRPKTPPPTPGSGTMQLYVPAVTRLPPSVTAPCAWGKTAAACATPTGPDPRFPPVRPNGQLPPAGGGANGSYGLDPKPPNTSGSKVGRPRPWATQPAQPAQPQVVVVSVPGGGGGIVVKPGSQVVLPTTTPPPMTLIDLPITEAPSSRNWLWIAAAVAGAYLLLRDKKGTS